MKNRWRGLSLAEVILCLSLIAIATLGLIAALTRLMVAQSSSSHQTVARIIADSVMQRAVLQARPVKGASPPTLDNFDFGTVQTEEVRVGQNAELATFFYLVDVERVVQPVAFNPDPVNNPWPQMGQMWQFKVTVWWNNENSHEGAIERGTETIEVTTLSYIEN